VFRYIDFSGIVSLSRQLKSVQLKASLNLLVQAKVDVNLVCRYSNTVSVSSADFDVVRTTSITKITIDLMTTIKVQADLLDVTSSTFLDLAKQMEDTMVYYWKQFSPESPPFFVKLEIFMTQETHAEYAVFRL